MPIRFYNILTRIDTKLDNLIKQPILFMGTQVNDQQQKLNIFDEMCDNIQLSKQAIYREIDAWLSMSDPDEKKAFCLFLKQNANSRHVQIIEDYCRNRAIDIVGTVSDANPTNDDNTVNFGYLLVNNKAGANEFRLFNVIGKVGTGGIELTHFESRRNVHEFEPHIMCRFGRIQKWNGRRTEVRHPPDVTGYSRLEIKRNFDDVPSNERQSFVLRQFEKPMETRGFGWIVTNGTSLQMRFLESDLNTEIVTLTTEDGENQWYDTIKASIPPGVELRWNNE